MKSPWQALLWELWRTSRFELLLRLSLLSGFILLFAPQLGLIHIEPYARDVVRGLTLSLVMFSSIFSSAWLGEFDTQRAGFNFRLGFTKPVPTWCLVIYPMFYTILTSVLVFLIPGLLYILLVDPSFPLHPPIMLISAQLATIISASWCLTTKLGKVIAYGVVCTCSFLLCQFLFPGPSDEAPIFVAIASPDFFRWSWMRDVGCLLVMLCSTVVTVYFVDRQRHWQGGRVSKAPHKEPDREPKVSLPAQTRVWSPWCNQIWYEWRRSVYKSQIFGLGCLILGCICSSLFSEEEMNKGHDQNLWLGQLIIIPAICQLIGSEAACGLRHCQGTVDFSPFDATRPFRNDQLIAIKLLTISLGTLSVFVSILLAAIGYGLIHGRLDDWLMSLQTLLSPISDVPWAGVVGGISGLLLLSLSGTSSLMLIELWTLKYRRVFLGVFIFTTVHVVLALWDQKQGFVLLPLWVTYGYLFAAGTLGLCIYSVWKALHSGTISLYYLTGLALLWGLYVICAIWTALHIEGSSQLPPVLLAVGASSLLLPFTTIILAPIALSGYRHQ